MLLPDIKVNINPKHAVYAAAALCMAGTFLAMGYQLAQKPKEVVCKNYIEEAKICKQQLTTLEQDLSAKVSEASRECVAREKKICTDLVEATAENIKRLRCRICKAQGVR